MNTKPVRVQLDDSPVFEAMADLDDRWNGSLRPRFTLDQVREVARYTQVMNREHGVDWETVHVVEQSTANRFAGEGEPSVETSALVLWVSWEFKLNSEGPSKWVTVVDPDQDGLYAIGGGSWAWSEVPEPEMVPVEELEELAGRHVPSESEFFVWHGEKPNHTSGWYYSLNLLQYEDEAAELIRDLPVTLILSGRDMEHGLIPVSTKSHDADDWYLAEAFCRLGSLPPATELSLSHVEGLSLSEERQQYLLKAMLRSMEMHQKHVDKRVEGLKALQTL
jgi:hypothetical protein